MRIAIAAAKGGVAKTTSTMFLARAAVLRRSSAVVLDADPQSSASDWAAAAEAEHHDLGFEVRATNMTTLNRATGADFEFVDTPPVGRILEKAVETADFVIIPTADSPLDLQQAYAMEGALRGKVAHAVLVIRAERGTVALREVLSALDAVGVARFETIVFKRQAIKVSMETVPEKLYEYAQVFEELRKELAA
jgi:chromosome partitioning protein